MTYDDDLAYEPTDPKALDIAELEERAEML